METALILGLGLFTSCWLLHVLIWRVHRPEAYPIWLPIIFLLAPGIATLTIVCTGTVLPFTCDRPTLIAAFFLHAALSSCYMGGYAGIIEYSPSAEILRAVAQSMPNGIEPGALSVATLSEQALTGKRIAHLMASRMATAENGVLKLTARGRFIMATCRLYRVTFGLEEDAKG